MTDIDSSLSLVTSEHPHLDASSAELVDRLRYAFLQLIFNGGSACKLKGVFNELASTLDFGLSVCQGSRRITVDFAPGCVLFITHKAVAVQQSAQALGSEVIDVLEAALDDSRFVDDHSFFDEFKVKVFRDDGGLRR